MDRVHCCRLHRRQHTHRRRRVGSAVKVGAAVLLWSQGYVGVAAQTCGLTPLTLSTDCNDACNQNEPCLAYDTSSCPSGASCVTTNDCDVRCFSKALDNAEAFTFLISFGSYESAQEVATQTGSSGASFEEQVKGIPDETNTYASASNDAVSNISSIVLDPTVTSFILAGGTSTNASVKSKVAKVTFGPDVISSQTTVTNVMLNNLDLSDAATLQQLPTMLPSALQKLSLTNTLLSAFPTLVANFTNLQHLNLSMNYITEVVATAALNSLTHLSFQDNLLTDFRAVFPNLVSLDLADNKFAEIPASIFIHDSLQELRMKGNPLASPWFTQDQITFLSKLPTLDLENSDFTKPIDSCREANQVKVHSLTVCISDSANDDSNEDSSGSSVFVIVGAVVGGILVLVGVVFAGVWLYRRRSKDSNDRRSKMMPESYFGGAVSPPLARTPVGFSPGDKGYRGGRRTPVSGGPRANGTRLNDIAILQLVATGQLRPTFTAGCPPELRMLAQRCLAQDPSDRPPAHVVAYELRVIQRSHYTLL
ncbi:hypothetical protein PHYBOEH_006445 [Phytophthora boehmeriae]|uniref:TKL protein kinase n=1 Tax=Phytophthora boehmeriae TaxID=109152 RepID=A0A8T1WIN1_9STRA|nr:hypothetical protein PHYBOEH_006445 [Phytophthora boehmeriae]